MSPLKSRLLATVAVSLLFVGCTVELQHDLAEEDANDIYVLLQKNGIEARKLKDESGNEPRYIIATAKGDVAAAAQLLREYSLPRPRAKGFQGVVEGKGMVPTQTEEQAGMLNAYGGEVSNALNRVPGVLEARAIVNIPESNDLTQPEKKPLPSASVFVKYRPLSDGRPPLTDDQIKSFTATSVPELKKESVTVLLAAATPPEAEGSPDQRMQDILGIRMTKSSADQFRMIIAFGGLVVLAMAALTAWTFVRGGSRGSRSRVRAQSAED